jgi:hypothetical protein
MLGRSEPQFEYTLHFVRIDQSLVEYALYEPRAGDEFDRAAREALEGILPDGRYTTYGYEPLGSDLYVEYEGRYFETEVTVTGRRERDRTVVYAEEVPEEETPSDALLVDDLDRADARVVRIHHPNVQTGGDGGGADLLTDDGGYVLRRPAELEGRFASGDLDGRVVSMTDGGPWNSRPPTSRPTSGPCSNGSGRSTSSARRRRSRRATRHSWNGWNARTSGNPAPTTTSCSGTATPSTATGCT